jgi:hypothetical protein
MAWCLIKHRNKPTSTKPTELAQVVTLLSRTWEVLRSNIGQNIDYSDRGVSWFSSVPSGKCHDSTLNLEHDRFLPHPFRLIILIIQLFDAIQPEFMPAPYNKLQINKTALCNMRDLTVKTYTHTVRNAGRCTTSYRLFVIAYSMRSQLPSITEGRHIHLLTRDSAAPCQKHKTQSNFK